MLYETHKFARFTLFAFALGACTSNADGTGVSGAGGTPDDTGASGGSSAGMGTGGLQTGGLGGGAETGGVAGSQATGGTAPNTGGMDAGGRPGESGGSGGAAPIANLKPAIMAAGYGALRLVSFDDGKTWRNRKVNNPSGGDDGDLIRAVNYVNGVWIAAGWKIFRSEDGLNWTEIGESAVPGGWYDCVTYDDTKQIWIVKTVRADAGGQNGGAVISKDAGKTWVSSKEPTRCDRQPMPFNTGSAQLRSTWRGKIERASGGGFMQVLQDCCGVEMFARGMAVDERAP